MKKILFLLIIATLMLGCARLTEEGFDRGKLASDVSDEAIVSLADYTTFPWDRAHIFPPYTSAETVESEVGQSVPFPHRDSEGKCLLVFVRGGKVVAALEIDRRTVDLGGLFQTGGYSRDEAVFEVDVRPADGWRQLKKSP